MSHIPAGGAAHVPAEPWEGRDDGYGPEHARWWNSVSVDPEAPREVTLVGFASDEGVRRNQGRPGAFDGPRAIRRALASMAFHDGPRVLDLGDVVLAGGDLASAQELLGRVAAPSLAHGLVVFLGGGHETAFGSFRALRYAGFPRPGRRLGIVNLDAHFDLRVDDHATSGTPFRQMADELGDAFAYWVAGIALPSNTDAQFQEADHLGVQWLHDEACDASNLEAFLAGPLEACDDIHLSIDLDVLPGHVAPGVSQPATLGVELGVLISAVRQVAASGRLRSVDVVELNPTHDVDDRTARIAARLVDVVVDEWSRAPREDVATPSVP